MLSFMSKLTLFTLFSSLSLSCLAAVPAHPSDRLASEAELKYSRSHSLGDDYEFNIRDGWETVNISDLAYKYESSSPSYPLDMSSEIVNAGQIAKRGTSSSLKKIGDSVKGAVKDIFKGLKAIGSPEPVTITWYTGHDLLNPSCWSNGDWAPTDKSFAAALTLEGWKSKPQCFKFLELCNSPKKCVYARVVDTCAGCAAGSKHVDLTRAAFGELASFDEGTLSVQMRMATEPDTWVDNLWGPKH